MSLWKKGINRSKTGEVRLEDYELPLEDFCEKLEQTVKSKFQPNSMFEQFKISYLITDKTVHWIINSYHGIYLKSDHSSNYNMFEELSKDIRNGDDPTARKIFNDLSYEDIIYD